MSNPGLNIEPEEIQPRSRKATIALRVGATILGAFLGFAFYIGGYVSIIIIDSELLGLEEYVMVRLYISFLIWTLLGLFTPFHIIKHIFGIIYGFLQGSSGKAFSFTRLAILTVILLFLLFIFWHILGFLAPAMDSLFSE